MATAKQFTIFKIIAILIFASFCATTAQTPEELQDKPGKCDHNQHVKDTGGPQCDSNEGTLELLQVVFRHGDRTPLAFYPTDPWRHMINWPAGLAQLTPDGRRKMVCLGNWLKVAYERFLCGRYNSTAYSIRSTNTDRTVQSAELFMMGIFPPVGGVSRDMMERVPLNTVQIQTVPCDQDNLLRNDVFCPAAIAEEQQIRSTHNTLRIAKAENEKALRCIGAHSGLNCNKMDLFQMSGLLYDLFNVEMKHNMCLPDWAKTIYPRPLQHLAGLQMFVPSLSSRLTRFRSGVLLNDIIGNMFNKVGLPHQKQCDHLSQSRRMYVYSAHDTTLGGLLGALGYARPHFPDPGSMVVFELRRKWDGTKDPYYVKIYYKRGHVVEKVTVPHCKCLCKLSDLNVLLAHVQTTPKAWRSECEECNDELCHKIKAGAA